MDVTEAGREEVSNDWQTSIGKERVRVEPKNIAQSSRNWYVPPLGLPLITKLSLCLSVPVSGIRCLSTVSTWPVFFSRPDPFLIVLFNMRLHRAAHLVVIYRTCHSQQPLGCWDTDVLVISEYDGQLCHSPVGSSPVLAHV